MAIAQGPELPKISRDSLWRSVYEHLWAEIAQGKVAPGERLSDVKLAAELGVSRGPVREALQRLEVEGLVTFSVGYGFRLRHFTDEDLDEIYTLRAALEGLAFRLVAGKLTPSQLAALETLVERMAEQSTANDKRALLKSDMEFHETIVAAAKHKRLYDAWAQLRSQISLIANSTARQLGREITDIAERHRVLVDALRAKTPTAAAVASESHISDVHSALRQRKADAVAEAAPELRSRAT